MNKNQEEREIQRYLGECHEEGRPLSVSGLAQALGLTRLELLSQSLTGKNARLKAALSQCEAFAENLLLESKNQTGLMFCLKNNFGWNDKSALKESSFEVKIKYPWQED